MLRITVTTDQESGLCPVRNVLAPAMGKWTSLIMLALEDGPQRFSWIKRNIGDVTSRVLTQSLRRLERDGHLTRQVDPGPPVKVRYGLTPMGDELVALYRPLAVWAEDRFDAVRDARAEYDETGA